MNIGGAVRVLDREDLHFLQNIEQEKMIQEEKVNKEINEAFQRKRTSAKHDNPHISPISSVAKPLEPRISKQKAIIKAAIRKNKQ